MWPFRPRCSFEQAMADGIDFALQWHAQSFGLIGEAMRRAGQPELGLELFAAETQAALCVCAYAIAAMTPSPAHQERLLEAARRRIDERADCLVQFDAYRPALAAIDGDQERFADFFFNFLPQTMLDRLDANAGHADARTRGTLAEMFNRVGGDIMRWTADHRKKHRVT